MREVRRIQIRAAMLTSWHASTMMTHFEMPPVCWIISSGYVYCWRPSHVWPKTKTLAKSWWNGLRVGWWWWWWWFVVSMFLHDMFIWLYVHIKNGKLKHHDEVICILCNLAPASVFWVQHNCLMHKNKLSASNCLNTNKTRHVTTMLCLENVCSKANMCCSGIFAMWQSKCWTPTPRYSYLNQRQSKWTELASDQKLMSSQLC